MPCGAALGGGGPPAVGGGGGPPFLATPIGDGRAVRNAADAAFHSEWMMRFLEGNLGY